MKVLKVSVLAVLFSVGVVGGVSALPKSECKSKLTKCLVEGDAVSCSNDYVTCRGKK